MIYKAPHFYDGVNSSDNDPINQESIKHYTGVMREFIDTFKFLNDNPQLNSELSINKADVNLSIENGKLMWTVECNINEEEQIVDVLAGTDTKRSLHAIIWFIRSGFLYPYDILEPEEWHDILSTQPDELGSIGVQVI